MSGMKSIAGAFVFILAVGCLAALAQGPARGRIEEPRDPELEITARHNLDVARWYITKRKAYQGGLDRLKEIVETYPDFSGMDEVVYWMGEANLKLDKPEIAVTFYKQLVKDYPESQLVKKARERLDELKQVTEKRARS